LPHNEIKEKEKKGAKAAIVTEQGVTAQICPVIVHFV
jgi:hypothetical protein